MALLFQRELGLKATLLLLQGDGDFVALSVEEDLKLGDVFHLLLKLLQLALEVLLVLIEQFSVPLVVFIVLVELFLFPGELLLEAVLFVDLALVLRPG